jgi:ribosomal protein L13E
MEKDKKLLAIFAQQNREEELRSAGYSAAELRSLGYSAAQLISAGYSAAQLRSAGYSAAQLRSLGYSAAQLRSAGYNAAELISAGYSAAELISAGYSAAQLRSLGYSAEELISAGYSAAQLRSLGYSAAELRSAGYSAEELRSAGYSAAQLISAGYSAEELRSAGYSAEDFQEFENIKILEKPYSQLWDDIQANKRIHNQSEWGPDKCPAEENICGTAMCTAGHLVNMAGAYDLLKKYNDNWAMVASLVHYRSTSAHLPLQNFGSIPQEWALAYIEEMAKLEKEENK